MCWQLVLATRRTDKQLLSTHHRQWLQAGRTAAEQQEWGRPQPRALLSQGLRAEQGREHEVSWVCKVSLTCSAGAKAGKLCICKGTSPLVMSPRAKTTARPASLLPHRCQLPASPRPQSCPGPGRTVRPWPPGWRCGRRPRACPAGSSGRQGGSRSRGSSRIWITTLGGLVHAGGRRLADGQPAPCLPACLAVCWLAGQRRAMLPSCLDSEHSTASLCATVPRCCRANAVLTSPARRATHVPAQPFAPAAHTNLPHPIPHRPPTCSRFQHCAFQLESSAPLRAVHSASSTMSSRPSQEVKR